MAGNSSGEVFFLPNLLYSMPAEGRGWSDGRAGFASMYYVTIVQGGKGAEIPACSPLQPRPSAGQPLPYAMLCFTARAGYKMEAFCCRIPPSFTQRRGQKRDAKIRLPFLPAIVDSRAVSKPRGVRVTHSLNLPWCINQEHIGQQFWTW